MQDLVKKRVRRRGGEAAVGTPRLEEEGVEVDVEDGSGAGLKVKLRGRYSDEACAGENEEQSGPSGRWNKGNKSDRRGKNTGI